MLRYILISVLMAVGVLPALAQEQVVGPFTYVPTRLSATVIGQATINSVAATDNDVIAAFDEEGNVAGAAQLRMNSGRAYFTLPIYGDDATSPGRDEGMNSGESFTLKLFDYSAGQLLEIGTRYSGWVNANGALLTGYDDSNTIYFFYREVAPVTRPDTVTTLEDAEVFVDVLGNDTDADGDSLYLSAVTDPPHGTASLAGARVRYLPDENYWGMDSLLYTVEDGDGNSRSDSLFIEVQAVNDAPSVGTVRVPSPGSVVAVEGESDQQLIVQWEQGADPDGDSLFFQWQLAESSDFETLTWESDSTRGMEVAVSYGTLDSLISAAEIAEGEQVSLYQRLSVSDGQIRSSGSSTELHLVRGTITSLSDPPTSTSFSLSGNYPNPASGLTRIRFNLPRPAKVRLEVFDLLGRRVRALAPQRFESGANQSVALDASTLDPGVYLLRLTSTTFSYSATGKIMVVQ